MQVGHTGRDLSQLAYHKKLKKKNRWAWTYQLELIYRMFRDIFRYSPILAPL